MFLPPKDHLPDRQPKKTASTTQPALLRSGHLIIHKTIRDSIFGQDNAIYMIYYPNQKKLMLAPYSNDLFRKMHKAKQYMLKEVSGGKEYAVALHGILLDHQIPRQDRFLPFEADPQINILSIYLIANED